MRNTRLDPWWVTLRTWAAMSPDPSAASPMKEIFWSIGHFQDNWIFVQITSERRWSHHLDSNSLCERNCFPGGDLCIWNLFWIPSWTLHSHRSLWGVGFSVIHIQTDREIIKNIEHPADMIFMGMSWNNDIKRCNTFRFQIRDYFESPALEVPASISMLWPPDCRSSASPWPTSVNS